MEKGAKKMNDNNKEASIKNFMLGAIFGALVSAVAALLFAPKSGKELRKDISESTTKTLENTDEYFERAREKGTEVMQSVEDAAVSYYNIAGSKMKSAFTHTEDQLNQTVDEVENLIDETVEEIKESH